MLDYPHKDKFPEKSDRAYHAIDVLLPKVHYDTAGGFSERVLFGDLNQYSLFPFPQRFAKTAIYHYEGMTAHRGNLGNERMKPKVDRMKERLRFLRGQ